MSEEQIQRFMGRVEAKIDSMNEKLDDHIRRAETKDFNLDLENKDLRSRIEKLELIVGRLTLKLGVIIAGGAFLLTRLVDWIWDKLS